MRPSEALAVHRAAIRRLVAAHTVRNARMFGSVLRGEDTKSSDFDILVEPTPETTLFDLCALRNELTRLSGVPVDVVKPWTLPKSERR